MVYALGLCILFVFYCLSGLFLNATFSIDNPWYYLIFMITFAVIVVVVTLSKIKIVKSRSFYVWSGVSTIPGFIFLFILKNTSGGFLSWDTFLWDIVVPIIIIALQGLYILINLLMKK